MDTHDAWTRALRETNIIRSRVSSLQTFSDTRVPYIFLSPSSINEGDTVVRSGEVTIQQPGLILPPNIPQLQGFDLPQEQGESDNSTLSFLFVRGIVLPSLKYDNVTSSLNVFEGDLPKAISFHANRLEREEDVLTGLLTGHEDNWQFSLLIYICSQITRNAERDIKRLLQEYRRKS